MDGPKPPQFLTRDQLSFQNGSAFQLYISSRSTSANIILIKGATKEGPFTFQHTTTSDGGEVTELFGIPDVPLWISVIDDLGNYSYGSLYIGVALAVNGDVLYQFLKGIVSSRQGLTWPYASIGPGSPKPARATTIVSADPAAGAELALTVTSGFYVEVLSVTFQLVTAAAAATRVVHLIFKKGAEVIYECIAGTSQIISLTRNYNAYAVSGSMILFDDNDIIIPIPAGLWLEPGNTIITETTALNASDNFGPMTLNLNKYIAS